MNDLATHFLTNPERVQLHQQWWRRENSQRLALIYTPAHYPWGGLDVDVPPDDIPMRKRENAAVEKTLPNDVLVTGYVDFATALAVKVRPAVQIEVERLLFLYIRHILERQLKSVEFLTLIRRETAAEA